MSPTSLKDIRVLRLRQLQHERGLPGPVAFGKLIGRRPNQTSDLLHGRTAFGEKVARAIEQAAGLPVGWLDEPVEEETPLAFSRRGIASGRVLAVPLLEQAAQQPGAATQQPLAAPLLLSAQWLGTLPGAPDSARLRMLPAPDDLMAPTIGRGDLLLVDAGITRASEDGVFVVWAHERAVVRRLRRRLDGALEISADSPAVKAVDVIEDARDLRVLGRVLWSWHGQPL